MVSTTAMIIAMIVAARYNGMLNIQSRRVEEYRQEQQAAARALMTCSHQVNTMVNATEVMLSAGQQNLSVAEKQQAIIDKLERQLQQATADRDALMEATHRLTEELNMLHGIAPSVMQEAPPPYISL